MSASLVYGLAVRVDALFAAVAMHRLLAKPPLALKMLINRRIAGTLASGVPSQVSLASLPIEILSRIHIELVNHVRRFLPHNPALFCWCCTMHVHSERLCHDCQEEFFDGNPKDGVKCDCDKPAETDLEKRPLADGELRKYLHEGCDGCARAVSHQDRDPVYLRLSCARSVLMDLEGLAFRCRSISRTLWPCSREEEDSAGERSRFAGHRRPRSPHGSGRQRRISARSWPDHCDHSDGLPLRALARTGASVPQVKEYHDSAVFHPAVFAIYSERYAATIAAFARYYGLRHVEHDARGMDRIASRRGDRAARCGPLLSPVAAVCVGFVLRVDSW
jgi:hypothetical protein